MHAGGRGKGHAVRPAGAQGRNRLGCMGGKRHCTAGNPRHQGEVSGFLCDYGRVAAIRKILDDNGFINIPIMAYSAKYASAFYGPFRDAAGSAPSFGDRKSYQMDPHNSREAMLECQLDVQEGADIIMVKPALSYLDVIVKAKERFDLPLAAYSVSGEYAMIKAAAAADLVDEYRIMCESALSIYRAGAEILITYYAKELAQAMKKGDIG